MLKILQIIILVLILSVSVTAQITEPYPESDNCFENGGVCIDHGYECSGYKNGRADDACCPTGTIWDLGNGVCTSECVDSDNDGYGLQNSTKCKFIGQDCDDGDSSVHPDAEDVCDGKDSNCDGEIDVCDRLYADKILNSTKPKETCNVGVCVDGDMNCDGVIDPGCPTESCTPEPEVCDSVDNDCDNSIDDGVSCEIQCNKCGEGFWNLCDEEECSSLGSCSYKSEWFGFTGSCSNNAPPQQTVPETCNGVDDNADGVIDEGCNKFRIVIVAINYNFSVEGQRADYETRASQFYDHWMATSPFKECKTPKGNSELLFTENSCESARTGCYSHMCTRSCYESIIECAENEYGKDFDKAEGIYFDSADMFTRPGWKTTGCAGNAQLGRNQFRGSEKGGAVHETAVAFKDGKGNTHELGHDFGLCHNPWSPRYPTINATRPINITTGLPIPCPNNDPVNESAIMAYGTTEVFMKDSYSHLKNHVYLSKYLEGCE